MKKYSKFLGDAIRKYGKSVAKAGDRYKKFGTLATDSSVVIPTSAALSGSNESSIEKTIGSKRKY